MMGVLREPDLYQCAIAYVAVYDLELMFKKGDIPTRDSGLVFLKEAVGEDKEDLRTRSPVHNLDKLKAPVFIVHGGEDFRVDIEHAYRLRKGLEKLGKPYEWLVKPKEGHGFYKDVESKLHRYRIIRRLPRTTRIHEHLAYSGSHRAALAALSRPRLRCSRYRGLQPRHETTL